MKNLNVLILLSVFSILSACANPFSLKAIKIESSSSGPISLKAATNLVSGGSAPIVTGGGYKVTNSIGVISTLPKVKTAGGYSVSSTLNSD